MERRFAGGLCLHGVEVHLRGFEVGSSSYLGRTDMQTAGSDDIARYVRACSAVDGVSRDMQAVEIKGKTAYVQPPRVILVRAYIDGCFRRETLRPDIHV